MGLFPVELLEHPSPPLLYSAERLTHAAQRISDFFRACSIEVECERVGRGPFVDVFRFTVEAGARFREIVSLADDLRRLLDVESVVILRVPRRDLITVHVSHPHRWRLGLRALLESDECTSSPMRLPVAVGYTADGGHHVADLTRMPHLLIGGASGSGTSSAMRAMLASLAFRFGPPHLHCILIDSARKGLAAYEALPHLLTPVIADPALGVHALQWAVRETEARYARIGAVGARNIDQYNHAADRSGAERAPLPYVVIVIDELGELMRASPTLVEDAITRLGQMSRAVGIHLVVATHDMSVDVVSGLLKVHIQSRMAFRCASRRDSRTIIDGSGAERLLGDGDALYLEATADQPMRIHAPRVSSAEAAAIAGYLRSEISPATTDPTVTQAQAEGQSRRADADDKYDEAARFVVGTGETSIACLQRHLRIGFSRAARLLDRLRQEGIL